MNKEQEIKEIADTTGNKIIMVERKYICYLRSTGWNYESTRNV